MAKLQLTFGVELDLGGVPAQEIEMVLKRIENNLYNIANRAVEDGMITDDTAAELENYSYSVDEVVLEKSKVSSPRP